MLSVPRDPAVNLVSSRKEKRCCQLFHSWQWGENLFGPSLGTELGGSPGAGARVLPEVRAVSTAGAPARDSGPGLAKPPDVLNFLSQTPDN